MVNYNLLDISKKWQFKNIIIQADTARGWRSAKTSTGIEKIVKPPILAASYMLNMKVTRILTII